MFFKRKKLKKQKVLETKKQMKDLFYKKISDEIEYNLVYAYNRDFNVDLNDYTYTSLILGYNEDLEKLIIIETDKDFSNSYNILKLTKKNFTKAIYNKNLDEYTIYLNNKKTNKIRFSLIEENYLDKDILAFIKQVSEVEDFKDFFNEFKRKPHLRQKEKK